MSIERKSIQLIISILPFFERYVCTGFGISADFYRRVIDLVGRTE